MVARDGAAARPLRIGVVNLMPRLETYEPRLVALMSDRGFALDWCWIRLDSHRYSSSDPAHLRQHYTTYDRALDAGPLDGLVLTGAPVEHLELSEVRYWPELRELLDHAHANARALLGICWGAMALAERQGLRKTLYPRKLSGIYEHRVLSPAAAQLGLRAGSLVCPQSRFAGFSVDESVRAERAGEVVRVAESPLVGASILATPDLRVVMHLGHPEYEPERLGAEWRRDQAAGRADVDPPANYDLEHDRPTLDWNADSASFARGWLARCAEPSAE